MATVFNDFHNAVASIGSPTFLIVGRKGAGKTAIAEYIAHLAGQSPNEFCRYLKYKDFGLEKVALGEVGDNVDVLFQFILYLHLTRLICHENNAVLNEKEYGLLNGFLEKNAGFLQINDLELLEQSSENDKGLDIQLYKNFVRRRSNRKIRISAQRAPYYKLLPDLKETVHDLISSHADQEQRNEYILLIDDLDVGVHASDKASIDALMGLLRVARDMNNQFSRGNDPTSK